MAPCRRKWENMSLALDMVRYGFNGALSGPMSNQIVRFWRRGMLARREKASYGHELDAFSRSQTREKVERWGKESRTRVISCSDACPLPPDEAKSSASYQPKSRVGAPRYSKLEDDKEGGVVLPNVVFPYLSV